MAGSHCSSARTTKRLQQDAPPAITSSPAVAPRSNSTDPPWSSPTSTSCTRHGPCSERTSTKSPRPAWSTASAGTSSASRSVVPRPTSANIPGFSRFGIGELEENAERPPFGGKRRCDRARRVREHAHPGSRRNGPRKALPRAIAVIFASGTCATTIATAAVVSSAAGSRPASGALSQLPLGF